MPRFFVDAALAADAVLDLPEAVVRHIHVLRLSPGDAITLFNGAGGSFEATLADIGKRHASARIVAHDTREAESPIAVTLAQGLAGGDKMDVVDDTNHPKGEESKKVADTDDVAMEG